MFQTPVLVLIFNRPDAAQQIFEVLKTLAPTHLYIAADGARPHKPTDAELCARTRQVFENITWNCNVHTLYQTENLGCKTAVTQAIDWFFEAHPAGIILEDDCVPHPSFFEYCAELLQKHQHSNHITHIAGYNPAGITTDAPHSYFLANIPLVWGWATWRRAWRQFTPITPEVLQNNLPKTLYNNNLTQGANEYLYQKFTDTAHRRNDSWAYSWTFTHLKNQTTCLVPTKNLVQNIGFDAHATHTHAPRTPHAANHAHATTLPLIHPPDTHIIHKKNAMHVFYGSQKTKLRLLIWQIKHRYNTIKKRLS